MSAQHQDQRRASILAVARPLHLACYAAGGFRQPAPTTDTRAAAQKRSHPAIVLAVCHAGIHASSAMLSARSLRGRRARAASDHTRAATVAALAQARGYMHVPSRSQAKDGSGNQVSGIGTRMSGDARAGRARRKVMNSPDGGLMSSWTPVTSGGSRRDSASRSVSADQDQQRASIVAVARLLHPVVVQRAFAGSGQPHSSRQETLASLPTGRPILRPGSYARRATLKRQELSYASLPDDITIRARLTRPVVSTVASTTAVLVIHPGMSPEFDGDGHRR
jgi:hypothetical protein